MRGCYKPKEQRLNSRAEKARWRTFLAAFKPPGLAQSVGRRLDEIHEHHPDDWPPPASPGQRMQILNRRVFLYRGRDFFILRRVLYATMTPS